MEDRIEESEFGRFGWVRDREGNELELWEPRSRSPAHAVWGRHQTVCMPRHRA